MMRQRPVMFSIWVLMSVALLAVTPVGAQGDLAGADEPITIQMYIGTPVGTDAYHVYETFLRRYEQLNPGVKIENLGQEHDPDKLMTMFIAGVAPDIIEHDAWLIADYFQRGLLAPVPSDIRSRLEEVLFPISVYSVMVGDNMVGVPVESIPLGLWYSREAMDRGGIADVPDDIEDLERTARRFATVVDGELVLPGIAHSGRDPWTIEHTTMALFIAEGGRVLSDDGELMINSPALYRMSERFISWVEAGDFFGLDWGWQSFTRFIQGDVPFGFGYPWWLDEQRNSYPGDHTTNFGVARIPGSEGRFGTIHYGHAYGVNQQSPHIEEAFKLLEWLSTEMIDDATPLGHYHATIGSLPIHRQDIGSYLYADERDIFQGFIDNMMVAHTVTEWRKFGANPSLNDVVMSVAEGGSTLAEAIDTMLRQVNQDMLEYRESLESFR